MDASEVIERLSLVPLAEEGGFFRQTYQSEDRLLTPQGERFYSTAIYYLVTPQSFSALHRLPGDEVFHFYQGEPVEMIQISSTGILTTVELGNSLGTNEPQVVVPKNTWQGTRLKGDRGWALLGCTMSPGFDPKDYQHGDRAELLNQFPNLKKQILKYT
mgnify:CR=1 FL=1